MAIKIPSPVSTISIENDSYPTHYDSLGGGGWWAVPDESYLNRPDALYGIPIERRKFGMVAVSISTGRCYMLKTPAMTRGGSPPGNFGSFTQDASRPIGYGGIGLTDELNWVEVFFRTVSGPAGKRGATGAPNLIQGPTGITGATGGTDWGFTGLPGQVLTSAGTGYPAISNPTLFYDYTTGNLSVGTATTSDAKLYIASVPGATSAMIGGTGFMVKNNAVYVNSLKTQGGITSFYYGPQIPSAYASGTALSFIFGETFTQQQKGYEFTYERDGHSFNSDLAFATGTSGDYVLFNFGGDAYQSTTANAPRTVEGALFDVIINKSAYLARGWTFTNSSDPIGSGRPFNVSEVTNASSWFMVGTGSFANAAFDLSELQVGWTTSMGHDPGAGQLVNLPTIQEIYDNPSYPGTKVIRLSYANQASITQSGGFYQSVFVPGLSSPTGANSSVMPNLDMNVIGNAGWTASAYGQLYWSSNAGLSRNLFNTPSFGVVRQPNNVRAAARTLASRSGFSIDSSRLFVGYDDVGRRGSYTGFVVGEAPVPSTSVPDNRVNIFGIGGDISGVSSVEKKMMFGIGNFIRISGSSSDGNIAIGSNINLLQQSFIGKPAFTNTRNDFFNPTGSNILSVNNINIFPVYNQSLGLNISFGMSAQSFYNMGHNYWGNEPGSVLMTLDQQFTQYGNTWARQPQFLSSYYYSGGYFDGTGGFIRSISGTAGTISQTATTGTNLIVEKPWTNFNVGSGVTLTYAYNPNIYVSGTLTSLVTPNPSSIQASTATGTISIAMSQGITSTDGSYDPATYYNITDWNIQYEGMTSASPIDIYDVGVRTGASVGVTVTPPGMAINVGSGTTLTSRIWPNRWISGVVTAYDFSSGGMTFTVNGSSEMGGNIFTSYQKYYGVEELVGGTVNGLGGWTVSSRSGYVGTGSFRYDPICATAAASSNYRSTVVLSPLPNLSSIGATSATMTFRGHSGLQVAGVFTDTLGTFYGNWRRWVIDDWKVDSYTSASVTTTAGDDTYNYLALTGGFLAGWDNNANQVVFSVDYSLSTNIIFLGTYSAYSRSNPSLRIVGNHEAIPGTNVVNLYSPAIGQYQISVGPWIMTGAAAPDYKTLRTGRWINSRINSSRTSLSFNFTHSTPNPSQAGVSSKEGFQTSESFGGRAGGLRLRPGAVVYLRTSGAMPSPAFRRVQQSNDINTVLLSDIPNPSVNPLYENISMTGGTENLGTGSPAIQLLTGWHPWTVNDYLGMNMLQVGDNGTLSIGPAPLGDSSLLSLTNEGAALVELAAINSSKYTKASFSSSLTGSSAPDLALRPQLILTVSATASTYSPITQFNPGEFWRGGTAGSGFSIYLGLTGSEVHSVMMAQVGDTATYVGSTVSSPGPVPGTEIYGSMSSGFLGGPNAWLKYNAENDSSRNLLIPLYKI